jgi:hypothetical protein
VVNFQAYGSEAGVAVLKWLPFGGLYLTGGLTPKNIKLITDSQGPFLSSMRDKGRVSAVINDIPVYAVMVENLGERGAHRTAFMDYESVHASIGKRHAASVRTHEEYEAAHGRNSAAQPESDSVKTTTAEPDDMRLSPYVFIALGVSLAFVGQYLTSSFITRRRV